MAEQDSSFEKRLSGGHPNSLGNTIEVVDEVLADPELLGSLYQCYFSNDEVVRLRTSNAMKRICQQQPGWLVPYIDRLLTEVASIKQASAQWTLAQLMQQLQPNLTPEQQRKATDVLKHNLTYYNDWIVLNHTMQTLAEWAEENTDLKAWLKPHLDHLSKDERKSVANRAKKLNQLLYF
ncbi:hypothetical protein [Tunicatimonas pelagia]|uniref:hypothetical protein n=1 Tax=Tunicatimonas pelagia TaxID=931531 RepID=UPI002665EF5D|nr:hypothetical protein [Tunicatimonas pelagia]WKN40517.1 hypothetical protein P0M28_15865 [Tunicatimonas pelagia]